jgi:hypothetical protein
MRVFFAFLADLRLQARFTLERRPELLVESLADFRAPRLL